MSYTNAGRVRNLAKSAFLLLLLFFSCSYAAEPAKVGKPTATAADVKPAAQTPVPAKSADAQKPDAATKPAAKSTGIDAVLVLDSSGSMKHTDPLNLRLPAAKLFIALLGDKDRAGVISFSDQGYPILGLTPQADDEELKKAYRRLMNQHHPDKLVSKGLPEEMIRLATQKTQEIKAAYERIRKARGTSR